MSSSNSTGKMILFISGGGFLLLFMCCGGLGFLAMLADSSDLSSESEVVNQQASQVHSQTNTSSPVLSKNDFKIKLSEIMQSGRVDSNIVYAVCDHDTFISTFGNPDSDISSIDSHRLWGYQYTDGVVQLSVIVAGGLVVVDDISIY